jgi:hypothetical protein
MSAVQVGADFSLTAGGASSSLVIGIKCASIAGTVTFQLQTGMLESFANVSGKTVSAANGWNYIKVHHNATGDAALLPLLDLGRIVVTTNGTGAGTIEQLVVLQEQ